MAFWETIFKRTDDQEKKTYVFRNELYSDGRNAWRWYDDLKIIKKLSQKIREVYIMKIEPDEPIKDNLPNGWIDWIEISEFIVDILNPKYRGTGIKGWQAINDPSITNTLQENSVSVLKILCEDLYGYFYNLHLDRNIVWDKMKKYIREKYKGLSDEAFSLIIKTYQVDDR